MSEKGLAIHLHICEPDVPFLRESRGIKGDKGGWQWVVAVSVVGSLANPSLRKMNGSGPGVVRQLTGVVIATRQPRNDPTHPCNIYTRPLLHSSFSTDSFFPPDSPISFSGQEGWLVSCRPPVYPFVYPPIRTKR